MKPKISGFISTVLIAFYFCGAVKKVGSAEEQLLEFSTYQVVTHLEHTCPNAADINPMQANACQRKEANNDMLKMQEDVLLHSRTLFDLRPYIFIFPHSDTASHTYPYKTPDFPPLLPACPSR